MPTESALPPTLSGNAASHMSASDELILAEEQLSVRTVQEVAGYARLEKVLITETQTITVEVTREEVRLVHRAADSPGPDTPALPEPAAADADRWMLVSREEVVITKRIVPLERVRLEVHPVTEQHQIMEQLRKDQLDTSVGVEATTPGEGSHQDRHR